MSTGPCPAFSSARTAASRTAACFSNDWEACAGSETTWTRWPVLRSAAAICASPPVSPPYPGTTRTVRGIRAAREGVGFGDGDATTAAVGLADVADGVVDGVGAVVVTAG